MGVTRFQSKRQVFWHAAAILGAALLPVVLILPMVYLESKRQADNESAITAEVVRRQVESILLRTDETNHMLSALTTMPSAQVAPELQKMGTLRPYFRSLVLLNGNQIYCSSVLGEVNAPLSDLGLDFVDGLPPHRTVVAVPGTALVPDRFAVVSILALPGGLATAAVVDGQYFLDLEASAAYGGAYEIDFIFGDNQVPLVEPGERATALPIYPNTQISKSESFPVEVRVTVHAQQLSAYRMDLWRAYLPFLLLAGLLCGYGGHLLYSRRVSLVQEIRKGMRAGEFHMAYQPLLDMRTGRLSGVEALLRWTHPRLGNVRPDLFIPVAEENGAIIDLTRHIFKLIAADISILGLRPTDHVGVNICGAHLQDPAFLNDISSFRSAIGADGPMLVCEVTEREALPDSDNVRSNMTALREQGVLWAIDDFGTGHSSLAYLERLQTDFLKIDRAFVMSIGTDAISSTVLKMIIDLAQRLNLAMIAEGIETKAQADYLAEHGVQYAQGYYFAKPMRASEFVVWQVKHHAALSRDGT